MKRVITANTSRTTSPAVSQYIETIGGIFYHSRYDITGYGTEDEGITLEVKYRDSDSSNMPTIHLDARIEDGHIYTYPTLTFPTLSMDDESYNDTIHYWLEKWEAVGRYITQLNEYVFDIADFYTREDEDNIQ